MLAPDPLGPRREGLWLPIGWTQSDFLASMQRLRRAGLVEQVVHNARTGEGEVRFTPEYLRLLQAGREPMGEPSFIAAWATGDPDSVKRWVRVAAASCDAGEVPAGEA